MKRAGNLLGTILDLGREMLVAGAEVWRVEDMLYDLCEAYCFKEANIWTISTCLHATVKTWDERMYTQIRSVTGRKYDMEKLERLYALCREVRERPTGIDTIRGKLDEIIEKPGISPRFEALSMVIAVAGFTVFYTGKLPDAIVGGVIALILAFMGRSLRSTMNNLLAYNTIAAFVLEVIALAASASGIAGNTAAITTAGILMLISGMGITVGIGDFLHGHTLSGLSETSSSLLGAGGIAIGITLALMIFNYFRIGLVNIETVRFVSNPGFQILISTAGCIGFAMMFGAKGKALIFSAIGAALTMTVSYLVDIAANGDYFKATLATACFVALFAHIVSATARIPSAIMHITCIIPLVPGSNLYFSVLGAVTSNHELYASEGKKMLLIALGIALGFILIDVIIKFIRIILFKVFGIELI